MSDLKKLGRNPLQKSKPVRQAAQIEKVIDEGPETSGAIEKIKSLKIELDVDELVQTVWSRFFKNFQ